MSVLAGICSHLRANKTHFLLLEDREEQTSSVQKDLDGCLPVVEHQGETSWPIFEFLH